MVYVACRKINGREYYCKVESYREGRKVRQRVLEYYGTVDPRKVADAVGVVKGAVVATYRFGDAALLYRAAERLGMLSIIDKYVPKRQGLSLGLELFLSAAHRLLDYKPSSSNLSRWVKTTHLHQFLGFDPDRITSNTQQYLMEKLYDEERNVDHLLRISKDLYDVALPLFGGEEETFFYDITSTYFEGDCCPIAMLGYNRDDAVDKLQINIGMVVNGKYGIPIMTKVFDGNVNDAKTVYEMVYYAKFILKKEEGLLIMDRGMDSEDNVKIMDTVGYDYVIGLRSNHNFVDGLKMKTDASAKDWETFENKGQTIKLKKFSKNVFGKRRIVLLYYNPGTAAIKVENRQRKIECAISAFKKKDSLTLEKAAGIVRNVKKYFIVKPTKKGIKWRLNRTELNRAKKRDGKFCIITNKNIEAAEIFKLYFSKDKIEKVFRHMKQDGNLHPTRKRLSDHVRVDVFICHLAYLLLTVAEQLVRQKKIDVSWDEMSSELKETRMIERQDSKGNKKFQIVSNNEIQKSIVKELSLSSQLPVYTTTPQLSSKT